ncbi:unnamed protein product [Tilletia caries]|nr:unnamed protein product [Tilletia caries]
MRPSLVVPSRWTRSSTSSAQHSSGLNCGRWDYIFSFIIANASSPREAFAPKSPPFSATAPTGVEDAATADISRVMLWHWVYHGASTDDGKSITASLIDCILIS